MQLRICPVAKKLSHWGRKSQIKEEFLHILRLLTKKLEPNLTELTILMVYSLATLESLLAFFQRTLGHAGS